MYHRRRSISPVSYTHLETIEKIKPILQQLGESFKNLMEKLKPVFQFFTTYVMAVIQGALSAVAPIISAVKNAIDFVSNIISCLLYTSRMKPVKLEKRAHIDGAVSIFDALAVKMKFHKEIGKQLTNAA